MRQNKEAKQRGRVVFRFKLNRKCSSLSSIGSMLIFTEKLDPASYLLMIGKPKQE
ncbi:MAG: hypothetical protein COA60_001010 [Robiginitomaculum sp.]|nr:hypothetical protein [Robiginitomaculum sp.]